MVSLACREVGSLPVPLLSLCPFLLPPGKRSSLHGPGPGVLLPARGGWPDGAGPLPRWVSSVPNRTVAVKGSGCVCARSREPL